MRILLLILILLFFTTSDVLGQVSIERQVIASYGHAHSNGGLSLSATAGETATETLISGTLVLTQGFQQAGDGTTGIEDDLLKQMISYKVFPNPTVDQLTVEVQSSEAIQLEISLYDVRGRALPDLTFELQGVGLQRQQLNLNQLASGRYMLMLKDVNGRGQISHKIEKQ